jgi:hypothetical protein
MCTAAIMASLPSIVRADSEVSLADAVATFDPFEAQPAVHDPFELAAPLDAVAYNPEPQAFAPQYEVSFLQTPSGVIDGTNDSSAAADVAAEPLPQPCVTANEKPLGDLGINIVLPGGLLPKDHASECWSSVNAAGGPYAAMRYWSTLRYYWDATCLCYRPLYFEEVNLERYGYGCCECLQPAASAAHFFATVPALPYCMAAHCPGECEYTLGHYRPGNCPPRRTNWPSLKPIAAAAEGGVLTGMIFLIP